MVCLDTDVIINFFRKEKTALNTLADLEESGIRITTTTINTFELWRGILKSRTEEEKRQALEFLNTLTLLEFSYAASQKAAEIIQDLKKSGEMIELTDIMIAAICISKNESLLTRNANHFERIPGLKLESFS